MPVHSPSHHRNAGFFGMLFAALALVGCDRQPAASPVQVAESPPPAPRHEGTWSAESATLAGAAFPAEVTKTITLTMTGGEYTVNVGGQLDKGTCATDTTTTPHRMTITGVEGPTAGKTLLAIADFPAEGEMRICYDMAGKAFPAAFESTATNGCFLVIYKRKP